MGDINHQKWVVALLYPHDWYWSFCFDLFQFVSAQGWSLAMSCIMGFASLTGPSHPACTVGTLLGACRRWSWDMGRKRLQVSCILWSKARYILAGWWFGTCFPYIGNNHPNWLISSEGLKLETTNRCIKLGLKAVRFAVTATRSTGGCSCAEWPLHLWPLPSGQSHRFDGRGVREGVVGWPMDGMLMVSIGIWHGIFHEIFRNISFYYIYIYNMYIYIYNYIWCIYAIDACQLLCQPSRCFGTDFAEWLQLNQRWHSARVIRACHDPSCCSGEDGSYFKACRTRARGQKDSSASWINPHHQMSVPLSDDFTIWWIKYSVFLWWRSSYLRSSQETCDPVFCPFSGSRWSGWVWATTRIGFLGILNPKHHLWILVRTPGHVRSCYLV